MTSEPERLARSHSEELDSLLGVPFKVLDDGFVRAIDYMGDDQAIVQAARVSYGRGTKKVHEDRGLIRYLLRHGHTTPFEMCEIKFHLRVPMDCWRQWIRHRTANVNEYSTRYSIAIDSMQSTSPTDWRMQSTQSKQGSEGVAAKGVGEQLSAAEKSLQDAARQVYKQRLDSGVAREQARKDLPLSTYTEAYWKIDLHNLLHFLRLRMDSHAQHEIRQYASAIGEKIVARWVPHCWEAFQDYRLECTYLSRIETQVLASLAKGDLAGVHAIATSAGWLKRAKSGLKRNRERSECEAKLESLGFELPWRKEEGP